MKNMRLFNDELNKAAVAIGNFNKLFDDIYIHREDLLNVDERNEIISFSLCLVAYILRVDILDRIERNAWSMTMKIAIPLGLFRFRRETLLSALTQIIMRLKSMLQENETAESRVNDILDKKGYYNFFTRRFSDEKIRELLGISY